MIRRRLPLLLKAVLFFALLPLACQSDKSNDSAVPEITVGQLYQKRLAGEEMFVLDVRTSEENLDERLDFTDLQLDYADLASGLDLLPADSNAVIYCYCRSGRRSRIATAQLRELGYVQACNVAGGMIAWKKAGYPVVRGE